MAQLQIARPRFGPRKKSRRINLTPEEYYGLQTAFCYTPTPAPSESSHERLRPPPLNPRQVCQGRLARLASRSKSTGFRSQARQSSLTDLPRVEGGRTQSFMGDRKSTRLNSSHQIISYSVFC